MGRIPSPLNKLAVPLLNSQVNQQFAPYFKQALIRDLFRGEKTLGKTLACGVGMPVARAVEAMEIAFRAYKDSNTVLPVILSHRFVKGTKALLGFTRFDTTAIWKWMRSIRRKPVHSTTRSGTIWMRRASPLRCTGEIQ